MKMKIKIIKMPIIIIKTTVIKKMKQEIKNIDLSYHKSNENKSKYHVPGLDLLS